MLDKPQCPPSRQPPKGRTNHAGRISKDPNRDNQLCGNHPCGNQPYDSQHSGEQKTYKGKLLWIGSPFFSLSLAAEGWDVRLHNFEEPRAYGWDDVVRLADGEPDVLVVADKSRPPFVLGMEQFPCRTVFYAVDTHIHSWYPYYAQGFDACILSLKDHLPLLRHMRLSDSCLRWFPAFAPDAPPQACEKKEWDCLFVGNVDAQRTPGRKRFLERLTERVPVEITRGDYTRLYPKARVVLNYCELGDLNFRVFEALGCGACLVTPHIGHGLTELFTPGEHLLVYPPDDVDAAEAAIRLALTDTALQERLAQNGLAAVDAAHRARHRAKDFSTFVLGLPPALTAARLARAAHIRHDWLKLLYLLQAQEMPCLPLRQGYLDAARGAFKGHEVFAQNQHVR